MRLRDVITRIKRSIFFTSRETVSRQDHLALFRNAERYQPELQRGYRRGGILLRDRHLVFPVVIRREAKMATSLSCHLVSERSSGTDKIRARDVTGTPHTAITSSRTK